MAKRYRWPTAYSWLVDAFDHGKITVVELFELIQTVDSDTIQEQLQSVMEEDGYFNSLPTPGLKPCPECDSSDVYKDDHVIICNNCNHESSPEDWNADDDEELPDD